MLKGFEFVDAALLYGFGRSAYLHSRLLALYFLPFVKVFFEHLRKGTKEYLFRNVHYHSTLAHIHFAFDSIGYFGDAVYHIAYGFGFFDRVVLCLLHQ